MTRQEIEEKVRAFLIDELEIKDFPRCQSEGRHGHRQSRLRRHCGHRRTQLRF